MATITYCKGLLTPIEEFNAVGHTPFEMFLLSYSTIFHEAACETVNHLIFNTEFDKSKCNTYLQEKYLINKRHASGVISFAKGAVDSAKECRQNHIKILKGKLKSTEDWIKAAEKKLKLGNKFYSKSNWQASKTGCKFPLSSFLDTKQTNWQSLQFQIHQKKRKAYLLKNKIEFLQTKPIQVKLPRYQAFVVGSKDETFGNQVCQWDGDNITFRVPSCLESKFGKYITTKIGNFDRNINRLPIDGSKTWHFFRKNGKWNVAVQFTPKTVQRISRHSKYGCIGIDINPSSIGWVYVDLHGNLKAHGQITLRMGVPKGQQQAQIVDACLQLATLATTYVCPIVCEDLDFSSKKEQLKEKGKKYARMLSGWAYSKFIKLLKSILSNRGIYLLKVNPAFTSLIGLLKYAKQYGLASDEAAAIAIARRGMKLGEKIPGAINAYLEVNSEKHVWYWFSKLNKQLKESGIKRHNFYAFPNCESLVKQMIDSSNQSSSKRKR